MQDDANRKQTYRESAAGR